VPHFAGSAGDSAFRSGEVPRARVVNFMIARSQMQDPHLRRGVTGVPNRDSSRLGGPSRKLLVRAARIVDVSVQVSVKQQVSAKPRPTYIRRIIAFVR
jgi:hypothetical protein